MAPARKPGSLGLGGSTESVQDGTLPLRATPAPGAVGGTALPSKPPEVVLCEKGRTVFSPNWKSDDGDTSFEDPKAYDLLSADAKKRIDKLTSSTDEDLKKIFRKFITSSLSTGELGGSMVDQFYAGSQDAMRHKNGSPLVEKARYTSSFLTHAAMVRDKIGALLPKSPGPGLDCQFLHNKIDVPTVNFATTLSAIAALFTSQSGDELTLKALIGGTQGLRITLQNIGFSKNHSTVYTQFSVDLRYEIFDNFGVGSNDIYTGLKAKEDYRDALVAFWILQHMRKGHKPFINWLEIETRAIGGHL